MVRKDYEEIGISIHAPRAGSDFLPELRGKDGVISIHAPRAGSDHALCPACMKETISIHAPRAGSDQSAIARE